MTMIRRAGLPSAPAPFECPVELPDDYARVSWAELTGYMRRMLLRDADQMSMAVSLELRVPFLDHELVEYVLGLPEAVKKQYPGPKGLLVEACRDLLPASVYRRPKAGFVLPMKVWMLGPLASFVEEGLRETFHAACFLKTWVERNQRCVSARSACTGRAVEHRCPGPLSRSGSQLLSLSRMKILRSIHSVNPALGGPIESVKQSSARSAPSWP